MALLVTRVLGDEVEVLSADNNGTVHLGRDDSAGEDTATDGDEAGERALLVCGNMLVRNSITFEVFLCQKFHRRVGFLVVRSSVLPTVRSSMEIFNSRIGSHIPM